MALSRRSFIGTVTAAGLGVGAIAAADGTRIASGSVQPPAASSVSPYGTHQAGIATPSQDRLAFAAFDLMPGVSANDLKALLVTWTNAIEKMTAGQPIADDESNPELPPEDTGEAAGLAAANLTITVGFGASLFDHRLGLAAKKPVALAPIPAMPGDALVSDISDGDLCVQACSDDPVVAFHAMRNLRRLGEGVVVLRWAQLGFGKTSSTSTTQATPRNLMGFKDGTNNLKAENPAALDASVWIGAETDQPWLRGGSYLVSRRITMRLEQWDRDRLSDQEDVIGRHKSSGAPLGTRAEFDTVPLDARSSDGLPVVPVDAHIRLAAPASNAGIKLLRRGYSFTDGVNQDTGELDAGLFFIAFQQDPRTGFIPVNSRLAAHDALNEYIQHTSNGLFVCPPGFGSGQTLGAGLFT